MLLLFSVFLFVMLTEAVYWWGF